MAVSIDGIHGRVLDKINYLSECCDSLPPRPDVIRAKRGIGELIGSYNTAIAPILTLDEPLALDEYNRELARGDYLDRIEAITQGLAQALKAAPSDDPQTLQAERLVAYAAKLVIEPIYEKHQYDYCKCGSRLTPSAMPGEIVCMGCGEVGYIVGSLSRDIMSDRQHIIHGARNCLHKQGNSGTSRHYRFWNDRLQAMEVKEFLPGDLQKISRALAADGDNCQTLTCKRMRRVLKDSRVRATHLNEHVPLLVTKFGGPAPPRLTHEENKLTSVKFGRIMVLYDQVNPGGNKPYYPYFLYKIWDDMFQNDGAKRRILNHIHMQSRRTVTKNDKIYKLICEASAKEDNLKYKPTKID